MKIKQTIIRLLFLSMGFASTVINANDAFMGSKNGNIFPDKSHQIQMVKERIYITLYRDSCVVNCKFWFYNHDFVENVEVGFPDFTENPAYTSPRLRNFTAIVNGVPVKVGKAVLEKQYTDQTKYTDVWFIWRVTFAGKDTTIIENNYTGSWGGTYFSKLFSYTIGTGRTWHDKIVDGQVIFDHSGLVSSSFIKSSNFKNKQIKMLRKPGKIIYRFKNYQPYASDTFGVEVLSYWDFAMEESFEAELEAWINSKAEARLMRNEIFARHGYIFKDATLKTYFEKQSWYQPRLDFSSDLLNDKELKAVELIKKYENTLR